MNIYQRVYFIGLTNSSECAVCFGRMACDQPGLSYPVRECGAGYYCQAGAQSTTPNQGMIHNTQVIFT